MAALAGTEATTKIRRTGVVIAVPAVSGWHETRSSGTRMRKEVRMPPPAVARTVEANTVFGGFRIAMPPLSNSAYAS